jgi:hypothetical protein
VRAVPAKVAALNRMYEAYSADMGQALDGYAAAEFRVIEEFLTRTNELLTAHTAKLRKKARQS